VITTSHNIPRHRTRAALHQLRMYGSDRSRCMITAATSPADTGPGKGGRWTGTGPVSRRTGRCITSPGGLSLQDQLQASPEARGQRSTSCRRPGHLIQRPPSAGHSTAPRFGTSASAKSDNSGGGSSPTPRSHRVRRSIRCGRECRLLGHVGPIRGRCAGGMARASL